MFVSTAARRRTAVILMLAGALAAAAACTGGDDDALSDQLRSYTDPGDGCPQVVSAIAYADTVLKPLGQEPYQDYTDEVRSRLSAIDGTVSLEAEDFPSEEILDQARTIGAEAARAAASSSKPRQRTQSLREYRRDAAELVLMCAAYVDPTPTPSP